MCDYFYEFFLLDQKKTVMSCFFINMLILVL